MPAPHQQNNYPMITGQDDRYRLALINKLYNPRTTQFLLGRGLKPGMQVLEVGCGAGFMATWFAKQVAPHGRVLAIDNSPEQLAIAATTAKDAGVNNIEFKLLDARELGTLKSKFDFIYGRAVLEFILTDHFAIFKTLFNLLKPQGILTYESVSPVESAHFSYPHQSAVDEYFAINKAYFIASDFITNFQGELYAWFQALGCEDIAVSANQPILTCCEDKSVLRLGALSARHTIYSQLSAAAFEDLVGALQTIEQDDHIILGFFRSLLVSGMAA